jgi:hypothetical protein
MRPSEISSAHRRLLTELAGGISGRLEADLVPIPGGNGDNLGIALHEGDRKVVIEIPVALLIQATQGASGRETLRTRIKARRDRMMFREAPRALPKDIAPMFSPGPPRAGYGRGRR